jgi:hypothetical protein
METLLLCVFAGLSLRKAAFSRKNRIDFSGYLAASSVTAR